MKASKFLDANGIKPTQLISASKKLGRDDAATIAKAASRVIVAKGKNVAEFKTAGKAPNECVDAMLGPTGNLRAPTLVVGKTVIVGFDQEIYEGALL